MTTRREFILSSCKMCLLLGSAGVITTLFDSCNTLKSVSGESVGSNQVRIPLSSFGEASQIMVQYPRLSYDIFVNKKADGTYGAVLMQCTHQDQPLTATKTGFNCASHGSKFDLDGNVLLAPATRPLTKYSTEVSGSDLLITLKPI